MISDDGRFTIGGAHELPDQRVEDGVLIGRDADVATWIQMRLEQGVVEVPFVAFGIVFDDQLVGGAYFFNFEPGFDMSVCIAVEPQLIEKPLTLRKAARRILEYPFVQCQLPRITAFIPMTHRQSVDQAQKLGFVLEGIKAETNVGMFGMTPKSCPFWREEPFLELKKHDGQDTHEGAGKENGQGDI